MNYFLSKASSSGVSSSRVMSSWTLSVYYLYIFTSKQNGEIMMSPAPNKAPDNSREVAGVAIDGYHNVDSNLAITEKGMATSLVLAKLV